MLSQEKQKFRVIIVDDESLARLNLRSLIEKDEELLLIEECKNGFEAVSSITKLKPDIVFLDIQMPKMNGFEVLEKIEVENIPAIVFVTAYDQYAIKAFEINALDYLLKPLEEKRFIKTVKQVKDVLKNQNMSKLAENLLASLQISNSNEPKYIERIVIKSVGKMEFLSVSEIDWIISDDYYVKIHTPEREYLHRQSLSDLEIKLNPKDFLRIHRSIIVNLSRIKEIQSDFQNKSIVILKNGKRLPMSLPRQQILDKMF